MDSNWWTRFAVAAALLVLSAVTLLPSTVYRDLKAEELPAWIPESLRKKIMLGLDLQGGLHLVMGVQLDKAIAEKVNQTAVTIGREMKEKGGTPPKTLREPGKIAEATLVFATDGDLKKFEDDIFPRYTDYRMGEHPAGTPNSVVIIMAPEAQDTLRAQIFSQVVTTVQNRIDSTGAKEASVSRRGDNQVLVEIPSSGISSEYDFDRIKKQLSTTARLEFRMTDDETQALTGLRDKLPPDDSIKLDYETVEGPGRNFTVPYLFSKDRQKLTSFISEHAQAALPPERELFLAIDTDQAGNKTYRTYTLKAQVELTGESIADTGVYIDQTDQKPYVSLTFDNAGAEAFRIITRDNVKRRMAIVLDRVVNSAPVIQSEISGGRAQITLGGLKAYEELLTEARDLSGVLRAGALPADTEILFKREVGPSLGRDSVERGTRSMVIAVALVILSMAIYYRLKGVFAGIALLLNLVYILAIMAGFEATLTLPGMAGLVLTLGMAVDANVIIYERIREELRAGKPPKQAVALGFDRAFWTIFDSNLTTLISAIILYQFGTGPLRGFAVSLSIGLICSMYSAIYLVRLMFDARLAARGNAPLSI